MRLALTDTIYKQKNSSMEGIVQIDDVWEKLDLRICDTDRRKVIIKCSNCTNFKLDTQN